jgi:hypothetical protein
MIQLMANEVNTGSFVEWDAVEGVQTYEIEFSDGVGVVLDTQMVTEVIFYYLETLLTGRPLGAYRLRVRGIDINNNAGEWSNLLIINYVGPLAPANLRVGDDPPII